jgi:hypothetical protein
MVKRYSLFIIAACYLYGFGDQTNSGIITFRDSVQAKIQVLDTSGCTVVFINKTGAKVSVVKTRVRTLKLNAVLLDYSSFKCPAGTPILSGMLEPAPKAALLAKIMNLPLKQQHSLLDSTIYYCALPLKETATASQIGGVAEQMQDLFGALRKKEISIEDANKKVSDSIPQAAYLACCVLVNERDLEMPNALSGNGGAITGNGRWTSVPKAAIPKIPVRITVATVRVVIISIKTKCIIFDEECSHPQISGGFRSIRDRMAAQGIIEKAEN